MLRFHFGFVSPAWRLSLFLRKNLVLSIFIHIFIFIHVCTSYLCNSAAVAKRADSEAWSLKLKVLVAGPEAWAWALSAPLFLDVEYSGWGRQLKDGEIVDTGWQSRYVDCTRHRLV
jgi:hypothetical protein